jgi:hypothetical protein
LARPRRLHVFLLERNVFKLFFDFLDGGLWRPWRVVLYTRLYIYIRGHRGHRDPFKVLYGVIRGLGPKTV